MDLFVVKWSLVRACSLDICDPKHVARMKVFLSVMVSRYSYSPRVAYCQQIDVWLGARTEPQVFIHGRDKEARGDDDGTRLQVWLTRGRGHKDASAFLIGSKEERFVMLVTQQEGNTIGPGLRYLNKAWMGSPHDAMMDAGCHSVKTVAAGQ